NIVLILADDLGWADLPAYGNKFHETPALDRLAREGARFTDFYAAAPVCSPTRASIFSGQSPARLAMTDFVPGHWRPFEKVIVPEIRNELPLEIATPAEILRATGYRTGYFGKWHLGGDKHHPREQGFDEAIVMSGRHFAPRFRTDPARSVADGTYLADHLAELATDFIARHSSEAFFLVVAHFAVHIPLEAPEDLVAKYERKERPGPGVHHPVYAAMIERIDDSVRRILETLSREGIDDRTLVVFTSDNGGLHRIFTGAGERVSDNAPLRGEKGTLHEGGIRVPFIARYPGTIPAGTIVREPAITTDLLPTFADIARVRVPPGQPLDGRSIVSLLRTPNATLGREALFFHYPHYHHSRPASAVRSGRWKLLENLDDGTLELYDLSSDLGESRDLAGERSDVAMRLRALLEAWRKEVGARMPTPNPKHDPARAGEWWSRSSGEPLDIEALRRHYDSGRSRS
ncbi:MAG TPA: sulfatase, partial [Planctomycetota bacterium]|nr:sulfatase [Planctomycetota bacterium]